jgi:hypothetical protein
MPLSQRVEGCLEQAIGNAGLTQALLDTYLSRLTLHLESLSEAHAKGTRALLRVRSGART